MKKVTLENGKIVEISDRSYANLLEEAVESKLKVGQWYKYLGEDASDGDLAYYRKKHNNYGFKDGEWTESWYMDNSDEWIEASDKEVEAMLIKEAKKKGFKEGVRIRGFRFPEQISVIRKMKGGESSALYPTYDSGSDILNIDSGGYEIIYKQGQWAEIIEDDKIKIGDYNANITAFHVGVGCERISYETVKKVYKRMKKLRKHWND